MKIAQGFFHKKTGQKKRENRELTDRIRKNHTESKQRYGAPKIHNMLEKKGSKSA
ncbi:hypothetical protein B4096_3790 [Heyndrickxia coagulans]|nr:hypothetical protein B4096_3790 [Heyndrickxia coagulans]